MTFVTRDGAITHRITGDTSGDGDNQSQIRDSDINKTCLTIVTTATAAMNVLQSIALQRRNEPNASNLSPQKFLC